MNIAFLPQVRQMSEAFVKPIRRAVAYGPLLTLVVLPAGCSHIERWPINGWLDPTQVGNFEQSGRSEIRDIMTMFEEPEGVANAEEPSPEDLEVRYEEPEIQPGDILRISIYELQAPNVATELQVQVRNSGMETFPNLGTVRIAGYTATELEGELKRKLAESEILRDADVQVSLLQSTSRQFTVVGTVQQPGNYPLPSPDYRLFNAIGAIGGLPNQVETIYVFRAEDRDPVNEVTTQPETMNGWLGGNQYTLNDLSGGTGRRYAQADPKATGLSQIEQLEAGPTSQPQGRPVFDPRTGEWRIETPKQPAIDDSVPVTPNRPTSAPAADEPYGDDEETDPFTALAEGRRVIAIPAAALLEGDPNYNIVIRPRDVIRINLPNTGEYYMGGNIQGQGPYQLTGRNITVKQAIISAGGFTPLAYPSRATLIRRIAKNEEQSIQINLDAIFSGSTPDFFLRPNDVVNVGSHPATYFLAVIRNAFRASYGFGFVYDRNFADADTFQAQEQIRQREIQEKTLRGLPI